MCVLLVNSAKNHIRRVFFHSDYYSDYVPIVAFMDMVKPPVTALCISVSTHAQHKENIHKHRDWPHTHAHTHTLSIIYIYKHKNESNAVLYELTECYLNAFIRGSNLHTNRYTCTTHSTKQKGGVLHHTLWTIWPNHATSVQQETINSQWAALNPKGWLPVWNDGWFETEAVQSLNTSSWAKQSKQIVTLDCAAEINWLVNRQKPKLN